MRLEKIRDAMTEDPASDQGIGRYPDLVIISASASMTSRSELMGDYIIRLLAGHYASTDHIRIRELPPAALARADVHDPDIAYAVARLAQAQAVVFITPTYKGSYSGLLKMFIDLLPQYALRGKVVLPLATGGTIAHVQMMDHAMRPVLQTMWPRHVAQSCFILDQHIERQEDGGATLAGGSAQLLCEIVIAFEQMVAHDR